jgi:hypothetical protein
VQVFYFSKLGEFVCYIFFRGLLVDVGNKDNPALDGWIKVST